MNDIFVQGGVPNVNQAAIEAFLYVLEQNGVDPIGALATAVTLAEVIMTEYVTGSVGTSSDMPIIVDSTFSGRTLTLSGVQDD